MSYAFRVTIGGVTYTEANFVGMAYTDGIPDTLDALAQVALAENWVTSNTSFTPSSAGSRTVVLSSDRINFPVGSVVALRCSGTCLQIGQVTAWVPSTRSLSFACKYHSLSGAPTLPWSVFPATGPAGGSQASWDTRPRAIDEGGYGGPNGLVQLFSPSRGYRVEGVGVPRPDIIGQMSSPTSYHRDGWFVTRSGIEVGPGLGGLHMRGQGSFSAVRHTPLRSSGRGMISVGWRNYLDAFDLVANVEIMITGANSDFYAGVMLTQNVDGWSYELRSYQEGATTTHPLTILGRTGTVTFVMGGYGTEDTGKISIYVDRSDGLQQYATPDMTIDVPDVEMSLLIRGKSESGGFFTTHLQMLYYSITEPLGLR